jgi:hypothetical protein
MMFFKTKTKNPLIASGFLLQWRAISRILSPLFRQGMIISLGCTSRHTSSFLPYEPGGSIVLELHLVGFTPLVRYRTNACALTTRFHPYRTQSGQGGMFLLHFST